MIIPSRPRPIIRALRIAGVVLGVAVAAVLFALAAVAAICDAWLHLS